MLKACAMLSERSAPTRTFTLADPGPLNTESRCYMNRCDAAIRARQDKLKIRCLKESNRPLN